MTTAAKVAGFVAALAAVFVLALGVGSVLGPVAEPSAAAHEARGAGAARAGRATRPPPISQTSPTSPRG